LRWKIIYFQCNEIIFLKILLFKNNSDDFNFFLKIAIFGIIIKLSGVFNMSLGYHPEYTEKEGREAIDKFCSPVLAPLSERSQRLLSSSQNVTIDSSVGKLAVYVWNSDKADKTIVLSHGWADSAACWAAYVSPLCQAGYRVIAFDHPAHGSSAQQTGKKQTMLPRMIKALGSVLDYAALDGTVEAVMGHSIGALACFLTVSGLDYVEKLLLFAMPPSVDFLSKSIAVYSGWTDDEFESMKKHLDYRIENEPDDYLRFTDFDVLHHISEMKSRLLFIQDKDDQDVSAEGLEEVVENYQKAGLSFFFCLYLHLFPGLLLF